MDNAIAQNCVRKYYCDICNYSTQRKFDLERHFMTALHKRVTNDNENAQIAQNCAKKYYCDICNYNTQRKIDLKRHSMSTLHKRVINTNENTQKCVNKHNCECGKTYKYIQGLYKHKKTCTNKPVNNTITSLVPQDCNLIVELIKQNNELQKQIIELSREPRTTNNTSNTTNNNQFNLNFFLNETCKNAINFSDFIENIKVSYDDLENNVKMGFVGGMTKIIVDHLKQLELNDRPIHCTDVKRETIYVKEDDQWEKDKSKEVIQKGIQEITCKNMNQLMEWREENPEYNDMDSELSELSIGMQQHSMAGGKREEFYSKIIKNLAKETITDKNTNLKIL